MTNKTTDQQLAQTIWDYMCYEQPPEQADLIIGLGCHDIGVARHSANLYQQGYASRIMFCGGVGRLTKENIQNEADWFAEEAIRLGVPNSVILRERNSTNTGENIIYAQNLIKNSKLDIKKIIIVHKPYMLFRDFATIMKQWSEEDRPEFIFSAEKSSMLEYIDKTETFESMVNIMVGDLQRIKEYPRLGFQIELNIPKNVWTAYEELVRRGYDKQLIKMQ